MLVIMAVAYVDICWRLMFFIATIVLKALFGFRKACVRSLADFDVDIVHPSILDILGPVYQQRLQHIRELSRQVMILARILENIIELPLIRTSRCWGEESFVVPPSDRTTSEELPSGRNLVFRVNGVGAAAKIWYP
jgi:hypothetical protein